MANNAKSQLTMINITIRFIRILHSFISIHSLHISYVLSVLVNVLLSILQMKFYFVRILRTTSTRSNMKSEKPGKTMCSSSDHRLFRNEFDANERNNI